MTSAHGGIEYAGRHYSSDDDSAWHRFVCGFCGADTSGAVIAHKSDSEARGRYVTGTCTKWIRCTSCGRGSVLNAARGEEQIAPPPKAGEDVDALPADIEHAYNEARECFSIGAHTACTLICRKILMHVAVDKGDGERKHFVEYIDYLVSQGYVTSSLKKWVERIKDNGNLATHELPPADGESAWNSLTFTSQMLRIIYEMPSKADQFTQDEAPPAP